MARLKRHQDGNVFTHIGKNTKCFHPDSVQRNIEFTIFLATPELLNVFNSLRYRPIAGIDLLAVPLTTLNSRYSTHGYVDISGINTDIEQIRRKRLENQNENNSKQESAALFESILVICTPSNDVCFLHGF